MATILYIIYIHCTFFTLCILYPVCRTYFSFYFISIVYSLMFNLANEACPMCLRGENWKNVFWTFIATAFAWMCSIFCFLHPWAVGVASLCWLPYSSCWKPRKLLGYRRKPHKKGKIHYVNNYTKLCICIAASA